MDDLISRQAAIEAICYNCVIKETCNGICDDTDRLRELQTLEPKHGRWIEYPITDGMNQCSECGALRFGESNYCPTCGAKMDGGEG